MSLKFWTSLQLLKQAVLVEDGKIIKRIPVASGLGGGSSNAAAVLVGLNKFWRLDITQNKLMTFAKKIGSDVPFFVCDSPFAEGRARGDVIRPLRQLNNVKFWHILVVPKKKAATPHGVRSLRSGGRSTGIGTMARTVSWARAMSSPTK